MNKERSRITETLAEIYKGERMENLVTNIIKQSSVILGVVSLVITLGIALVQERRKSKELDKETIRLTDEIVTIIIRNCLSNISIKHVDLNILIEGFSKIRNGNLRYNAKTIMTMVYAKIYENDHLNENDKKSLLSEIEYELLTLNQESQGRVSLYEDDRGSITLSVAITLATVTLIYYTIDGSISLTTTDLDFNSILLYVALILTTLVFVPIFSNYTAKSLVKRNDTEIVDIKHAISNMLKSDSRRNGLSKNFSSIDYDESNNTVKIKNEDQLIKCLKNRYIIENLIAKLSYSSNSEIDKDKNIKRLGIRRMISLINNEIISEELKSEIYEITSHLNRIAHEYEEMQDMEEEIELSIHKSDYIIKILIERLSHI